MLSEFVRYLETHPEVIAVGQGIDNAKLRQRLYAFLASQKQLVYVSGPYSTGDTILNVRRAIVAGTALRKAGFLPLIPHLTAFWHLVDPAEYEDWMELDLALVDHCQALVRLPGESPGADREVARAKEKGIPVYVGVASLLEWD